MHIGLLELGLGVVLLSSFLYLAALLFRSSISGSRSLETREGKGVSKPEYRGYTKDEVAVHCKEGDLWVILKEKHSDGEFKVYDLSEYVDQHPGGDAIYNNAGGDATVGFNGPQHPPTVHDLVKEYCIGYLVNE